MKVMQPRLRAVLGAVLALGALGAAQAASKAPVAAENGMVVSAQHLASRVGVDVLKRGGNAVDAAVAVGYALAVVYPAAGLPELALRAGAPLAIVNASETHLDPYATVRLTGQAGAVLPAVVERLRQRLAR